MTIRQGETVELRPASPADSDDIAYLIDQAGEGLPAWLWQQSAPPGMTPLAFGSERARRPEGNFSYRNVVICEQNGQVAGMLLGMPQPDPYPLPDLGELPPQVRPLIELEALAPGSYYVNAVAAFDHCRGQGVGTRLMAAAESLARKAQIGTLSLIVASENHDAARLYQRLGYQNRSRRAVVPYAGALHGGDWILMTKAV